MRRFLWVGLILISAAAVWGAEKITSLTVGDREMRQIRDVHLGEDGRVVIWYSSGGVALTQDKLPDAFLASWGITRSDAQGIQAKKAQENLDKAVAAGVFREIDGIVYNTRKPQAGWVNFHNAQVIQILDDGAIVVTGLTKSGEYVGIFVRHLPENVGDTDRISLFAKPAGTYTYVNQKHDSRTIRAYDLGRRCTRDELPQGLVEGTEASARLLPEGLTNRIVTRLPDSDALKASGSGFFISENGYLISNYHVVENAGSIKVMNRVGIYAAEVVKKDKAADLALLKVSGTFAALSLSERDDVQLGEAAFTIGFPNIDVQGVEPKYTDGKISSLAGLFDNPTRYQISVPIQPGNSGGPLVASDGTVIGVIVARLNAMTMLKASGNLPENVNYAVKGKVLREFLKTAPIPDAVLKRNSTAPGDSIRNTEQSVAMVLVY